MTTKSVATKGSSAPAIPHDVPEGLEDVGASDILLPIIKVNHVEGVFQDSLSNEQFESFTCIMLGLVKGRVLWPSIVGEEGQQPLCRSLDFQHGRPAETFIQKDPSKKFPSKDSGFARDVVEEAIEQTRLGSSADQSLLLTCGDCGLKEWDTMPGNTTPWCSEQFTFPILRIRDDGGFSPAYITFQRASLKACKAYISSFRQANRPMYTVETTIRAIHQRKGTVAFVTPEFTKGGQTDPSNWPEFSENLSDIRSFLTTARVRDDDSSTDDDDDDDEVEETKTRRGRSNVIDTTATDVEPDDEEIEEEEEEEDDEPAPVTKAKVRTPAPPEDDDDDDEDEEPF